MRSTLALLALAIACARAPLATAPLPLPIAPPAASASLPRVFEPRVGEGACDIGGDTFGVTLPVALCGASNRACFGRISDSDAMVRRTLRIAPSLDALLVYERAGVVVSAVIDGRAVAPHLAQLRLVGGFFAPSYAQMTVTSVGASGVTMAVVPGDEVQALSPLTVHTTCDEVTANFPDVGFEDVARIAHLEAPVASANIMSASPIEVRVTHDGPVVALVSGSGALVTVHRRLAQRTQITAIVPYGFVVGWVADDVVHPTTGGSHRTRAPRIHTSGRRSGVACAHPVDVIAHVGDDRVYAATIEPGTRFEPADIAEVMRLGGVEATRGATFHVPPGDIADCTRDE